jgi:hypothetical protein
MNAPSIMRTTYESYINQGFYLVPIAPGSKGPKTANWNRKENCLTDASTIPETLGVGLAHAYSGTCSIDIDDWNHATSTLGIVGIDLKGLFDAPNSVCIHSGNPGHAKLIYRLPFGLVLPSKKCIYTTAEGIKKNWIDFRCATADGQTVQDVLPSAAIHPVTQRHYQWAGNGHYTNIPLIPGELMAYWRAIIDSEETRNINVQGSQVSASWDEIKQALTYISPDCDRDQWVMVLMALHHAGTVTDKLDEALALADEWSSQSETKYKGQADILNSWRGFRPDKGVTLGSLFHAAGQNGWHRPAPDVSALFTATVEQVATPKSLVTSLHVPPPKIDIDLLPPLLAQRAKEVGVSVGCDPLVAAWAGLGAAAAAIDARTRLDLLPGWSVPPVLWLCTVGAPADKKTPAARPMLGILKTIEIEDRVRHAAEVKMFEARDAAYSSAKKAYTQAAADPTWLLGGSDVAMLPLVPEQPIPPIPKRLVVSDITSQKLVRMCAERPQGLLCHLDEMKSWADKVTNPASGESRSSWTKSYECDYEAMDRVGNSNGSDNNIVADNFAVSIYGNMQPRVFKSHLRALSEDGLLQRFIPAILRPEMSDTKGEPIPEHLTTQSTYEQHIRLIHALPVTHYRLSPEAFVVFREFQDWYISLKKDERLIGADDTYMTALGKIEGTCGRIMLFWHLFDAPHSQTVSADTAIRAIRFIKQYVVPALRYSFGEVGGVNTDSHDQYIYEYVLQHAGESATITLSDLKRSMRRRIEHLTDHQKDDTIRMVMYELERVNWVKTLEQNLKTHVWAIDARLAEYFGEHRKDVIEAKQRLYDRIHEVSEGKAPRRKVVGSDIL